MKKIFLFSAVLLLCLMQSCIVSPKPNMSFFENPKYDLSGAKFTSLNIPVFLAKPIVKKALREDGESEELISLIQKVSDIKVMTVENAGQVMLGDFSNYLKNNRFEEWITVKKENEVINFQAKQNGETIRNLFITVRSGNQLVLVDVSGKFTADDISRIINYSEKNEVRNLVKQ